MIQARPAQAEVYRIAADAWSCQGAGALYDMKRPWNLDDRREAAEFKRLTDQAHCLPELSEHPVGVMAFQGDYAFICERSDLNGPPMFDCTYVLTKDLLDERGNIVKPQVSKVTPAPHFFDAAPALRIGDKR